MWMLRDIQSSCLPHEWLLNILSTNPVVPALACLPMCHYCGVKSEDVAIADMWKEDMYHDFLHILSCLMNNGTPDVMSLL